MIRSRGPQLFFCIQREYASPLCGRIKIGRQLCSYRVFIYDVVIKNVIVNIDAGALIDDIKIKHLILVWFQWLQKRNAMI